jgi:hypothetical protein
MEEEPGLDNTTNKGPDQIAKTTQEFKTGETEKKEVEGTNENDESKKPAVQTKPEQIDLPGINKTMEVHHHPQLDHKPKPWKEYLLEGLMIFIAVMLGFFAENVRESITNRQHVRELVLQLAQDLKADTAKLNTAYKGEIRILNADDSLIELLQKPIKKEEIGRFLKLMASAHSLWPFHPSGGAISAIKNELHLKQFSSTKMIGYISEYEGNIELLHTVQDITLQYQRSFLDPFLLQHVDGANLAAAFKQTPLANPELRNLSEEDLIRLGSDLVLIRINTRELLDDNLGVKACAEKLLEYIKKQYDLDED